MNDTTERHADLTERARAILVKIASLVQQASDEDALRRCITQASDELGALAQRADDAAHTVYSADSLVQALLDDYCTRQAASIAHHGVVGVRTGLDHLDETLNGLQPGMLYLLGAMPGTGKTSLCLQVAATVAQAGEPALYISLENDHLDLVRKCVCRLGGVSYASSLKGKLSMQEWQQAVASLSKLGGRLYLSTPREVMPDLTALLDDVTARAGRLPALVVIDYIQAWVKRSAGDAADVRERVDRFTPMLRALGERHRCAVLAISSQNRANYERGGMSSLKESGDLEYGADCVLSLMRKVDEDKKPLPPDRQGRVRLSLTIDKNRSGMTGFPIDLLFSGDHCMMEEEDQ